MRILLAQNSLYYPAHGGGDKSNRLLIEALAARGHECRVVARLSTLGPDQHAPYLAELQTRQVQASVAEPGVAGYHVVSFELRGVQAHVVTGGNLRKYFAGQVEAFQPDIILASTDDPAQLLLPAALRDPRARVVYLARATLAVPFGPDCAFPSEAKTARLRQADAVIGVSQYVADYVRRHAAIGAVHVPISLMEPSGPPPSLGRFENEFITIVNPCAVKGISIFLALADTFPDLAFAAVPTWGTNPADREQLRARPNVTVLAPFDDINALFARTRVLLVPSLWAEARSRIVVEAMLRGVPVIAADTGGIREAKMGVPHLLSVNPIVRYHPRLDEQMVPEADVPPQDIAPWRDALRRLTTDRARYADLAARSRAAALRYVSQLSVEPFENLLRDVLSHPRRRSDAALPSFRRAEDLTPDRRRLLALRLRRHSPATAFFPGAEAAPGPRLFCLPHAGAGSMAYAAWKFAQAAVCAVRMPGRESRRGEAPFDRMQPLIAALADAIAPFLDRPYGLFGHSMGAIVAFELARELRRRGQPPARLLIASGARAPQFRRNHAPPPDPSDEELLQSLRRVDSSALQWSEDPDLARAIMPAVRADTSLYRHYIYEEEAPFDFPIRAYGGLEDPNVTLDHLERWGAETRGSFAVRQFSGGHFYLRPLREGFRLQIAQDLEAFL